MSITRDAVVGRLALAIYRIAGGAAIGKSETDAVRILTALAGNAGVVATDPIAGRGIASDWGWEAIRRVLTGKQACAHIVATRGAAAPGQPW